MVPLIVTGALAGIVMGYVLQRGQLCFHSGMRQTLAGEFGLARAWVLGVAIAAVGLAFLYAVPLGADLNQGLAFRPAANITGGLILGIGMVVARSCVSGLFFKLGSGMAGALVGLLGWGVGEVLARPLAGFGPTVLSGSAGTLPAVLGLPRLFVAVGVLILVVVAVWARPGGGRPKLAWQWGWATLGVALGAAITVGWILAALGGVRFGPSSTGVVAGVVSGSTNWWLVAFVLGIIGGGFAGARQSKSFRLRGEEPVRYAQLGSGGILLGAGGMIAGGCNLGHGLSGAAQLNVSSLVVVAAMLTGVWAASRIPALA